MPKAKQPSLADELLALPPSRPRTNPISQLSDEQKEEWEKVKQLLKAGALKHLSLNEIRRRLSARFNFNIPRTTFRDFLVREGVITQKE
jgi:hypothetical protein